MDALVRSALLLNAVKIPFRVFTRLCDVYGPDELEHGESFWRELGMTDAQSQRLSSLLAHDRWPEKELERLEKFGARFITARDTDYPVKLLKLKRPPIGLYVKGRANISLPSVAVVGTRKPSDYGLKTAENLGRRLARDGIITISGGAKGIDASAHRGALSEDGVTIAVFGTGIDRVYPTEHRELFRRILERGALISEYPMNCPGESWRFPERNRIIAGMATRTVVVESPPEGGALNTAKHALDLDRDVSAVPGRITDETCRGSNELLSSGADVLSDVDEFVSSFASDREQFSIGFNDYEHEETHEELDLEGDEKVIYALLQSKGERTADALAQESGLDVLDVQSALVGLMAGGLVSESSGRYSEVKR